GGGGGGTAGGGGGGGGAPGARGEVVPRRGREVRDRGGERYRDAEHGRGGVPAAAAETGQHPGRTGAHQVQRGGVGRAPADDHRHVQLVDELLEVQRLGPAGDMLRRHGGAPQDGE